MCGYREIFRNNLITDQNVMCVILYLFEGRNIVKLILGVHHNKSLGEMSQNKG